jgi:hypothetical protein
MKTFEHLNDTELVSLTQDEINHYIKLKKAETGVRLLTLPDTPTYQDVPSPDVELYEVAGYAFADKQKAQEIADAINKNISLAFKVDYDYWGSGSSDYKYAKPYDGSLEAIGIQRVFSQPVYNSIKTVIASNKKVREAWEKLKSEYEAEDEKATEIVNNIYDAINPARDRLAQFQTYKTRITEYLQLANGDRDIAWNFFDKAYSVEPSVKSMIMESKEYQDALSSYIDA